MRPLPSLEEALAALATAVYAQFGPAGLGFAVAAAAALAFGLGAKLVARRSRQHLGAVVAALAAFVATRQPRHLVNAALAFARFWGTVHSTESPAQFLRLAAKRLDRTGDPDAQALAVQVAALEERADALERGSRS
jgi:hypothetical protein